MAGQVWGTSSLGGYMYALNLSKELRMSLRPIVKFRQFADVKDAAHQGLSKGDTFHWNVYSTVATGGAALVENTAIAESNFTITQGTMSITEYGNSIPFTSKLDDLSEHPVKEIIHKVLKIDAAQVLDSLVADQIDTCLLRVVAETSTTSVTLTVNGTATLTNTIALGKGHIKAIVDVAVPLVVNTTASVVVASAVGPAGTTRRGVVSIWSATKPSNTSAVSTFKTL